MGKVSNPDLHPDAMQVIINIQEMKRVIYGKVYNASDDFFNLQWKKIEDLRATQSDLLRIYNLTVKSRPKHG